MEEPKHAISAPLPFHWQKLYSGALASLPDHHSKLPATLPRAFYLQTKGASRDRASPQDPGLSAWSCSSPTNQASRAPALVQPASQNYLALKPTCCFCTRPLTRNTRETVQRRLGNRRSSPGNSLGLEVQMSIITSVPLHLHKGGRGSVRYSELARLDIPRHTVCPHFAPNKVSKNDRALPQH